MEWWEVGAVSMVFSAAYNLGRSLLTGVLQKNAREEEEYFAPERAQAYAQSVVDRHVREFHVPQQQLMERQAQQAAAKAAMTAEVV